MKIQIDEYHRQSPAVHSEQEANETTGVTVTAPAVLQSFLDVLLPTIQLRMLCWHVMAIACVLCSYKDSSIWDTLGVMSMKMKWLICLNSHQISTLFNAIMNTHCIFLPTKQFNLFLSTIPSAPPPALILSYSGTELLICSKWSAATSSSKLERGSQRQR